MLSAIDFDYQPLLRTEKIDDIRPKWHLLAESYAVELLAPQPRPKCALGVGAILAQSATFDVPTSPPPQPAPIKGAGEFKHNSLVEI